MIPRSFFHCALVILILTATPSILAQDLRDRELNSFLDLARIQMPLEIVSIKVQGKEVQPGEKVKGDDDWLKGLSFTLKNISNKAIAYVAVSLRFHQNLPKRVVGFTLSYGVDYSRGEPRRDFSPPAIQPGQTVELTLTEQRYPNFQEILNLGGIPRSFDSVPYLVERISFEDDPEIIWEGGFLMRRDPTVIGKFNIVERYVLPTKQ